MTINATFVKQLEDGSSIYRVELNDPAHLEQPIVSEIVTFDNEIVLAEPIRNEEQ